MAVSIEIRLAEERDIPAMAAIRAREWQTEEFWTASIGNYLRGAQSPQHVSAPFLSLLPSPWRMMEPYSQRVRTPSPCER